jgi:Family of unknown function (DUF6326)
MVDDLRIDVRFKIAALWAATLFLFAYGDIFGFFRPGQLRDVMAGKVSGVEVSQGFLLATSAYITIPTVMVFLSLVLQHAINRWTNIVLAVLYAASVVLLSIGEGWAYYYFLSAAETILLSLIVWSALRWSRAAESAV